MVFLAGKDLPQLLRAAIEEYAINHKLISADPEIWKKLEAFAFNQFAKNKTSTPEEFMGFLEETEGGLGGNDGETNRFAPRPETTANVVEMPKPQAPVESAALTTQVPKTSRVIDFGPAETPAPPAPESTIEPEQQSTAAEYNRWFKDQDNY